jgi:glycosyltransferase involved in cell wall biosynthesis
MASKVRLAYLVTHPIQYQAPLLRRIAQEPEIDLTVFFCSDLSVREFVDTAFGRRIKWDVPLLDGYRYEFLPAIGGTESISFWRPFNYGLVRRLQSGKFDVLWIHGYARCFHWVAMLSAKLLGMKILVRDEATLISKQRPSAKRLAKKLFFHMLKSVCDGFLAIGSLNREYYLRYGIEEERIFLMPYAVDNRFFRDKHGGYKAAHEALRKKIVLDKGRPVILYAGKMTERKRPGHLLEAYIRLSTDGKSEPNPYLLFIGDGEMQEHLEKRILGLGWTSVKFLGFINQSELPIYYDLCDIFVLPAIHEPWGLVVNEAMNAGCSVIVSDQVGCAPDLVKDGENGCIFKAGSINSLCYALQNILDDPVKLNEMGEKSIEIISKWGIEENVVGLKCVLKKLLK